MSRNLRALIVDGYNKQSRDEFDQVGMTKACDLYQKMLLREAPRATAEVFFPSDGQETPAQHLSHYDVILWTGCNLTVYRNEEARVRRQIELAKSAFERGIPSFGSCWGIQIAAVAAGGTVKAHPKGREMGVARKITLTEEGKQHPMYRGKNQVFDAFISHDDEVTQLPKNSKLLAGNEYSTVQAAVVQHGKGEFWAVQYHPEYDLYEMAKLILARQEKLIRQGFFNTSQQVEEYSAMLENIDKNPSDKALCWQYAIDRDLIDQEYRCLEFTNFMQEMFPGGAA